MTHPFPPPGNAADNACLSCGVCCMSYRVAFHWSETTAHPQGRVPVELTEPLRHHEVVMRGTRDSPVRCIALHGLPGQAVRCAIHGTHPQVCREVALGSDQCARARLMHGLPPLPEQAIALSYAADDPPAVPLAGLPDTPMAATAPAVAAADPAATAGAPTPQIHLPAGTVSSTGIRPIVAAALPASGPISHRTDTEPSSAPDSLPRSEN